MVDTSTLLSAAGKHFSYFEEEILEVVNLQFRSSLDGETTERSLILVNKNIDNLSAEKRAAIDSVAWRWDKIRRNLEEIRRISLEEEERPGSEWVRREWNPSSSLHVQRVGSTTTMPPRVCVTIYEANVSPGSKTFCNPYVEVVPVTISDNQQLDSERQSTPIARKTVHPAWQGQRFTFGSQFPLNKIACIRIDAWDSKRLGRRASLGTCRIPMTDFLGTIRTGEPRELWMPLMTATGSEQGQIRVAFGVPPRSSNDDRGESSSGWFFHNTLTNEDLPEGAYPAIFCALAPGGPPVAPPGRLHVIKAQVVVGQLDEQCSRVPSREAGVVASVRQRWLSLQAMLDELVDMARDRNLTGDAPLLLSVVRQRTEGLLTEGSDGGDDHPVSFVGSADWETGVSADSAMLEEELAFLREETRRFGNSKARVTQQHHATVAELARRLAAASHAKECLANLVLESRAGDILAPSPQEARRYFDKQNHVHPVETAYMKQMIWADAFCTATRLWRELSEALDRLTAMTNAAQVGRQRQIAGAGSPAAFPVHVTQRPFDCNHAGRLLQTVRELSAGMTSLSGLHRAAVFAVCDELSAIHAIVDALAPSANGTSRMHCELTPELLESLEQRCGPASEEPPKLPEGDRDTYRRVTERWKTVDVMLGDLKEMYMTTGVFDRQRVPHLIAHISRNCTGLGEDAGVAIALRQESAAKDDVATRWLLTPLVVGNETLPTVLKSQEHTQPPVLGVSLSQLLRESVEWLGEIDERHAGALIGDRRDPRELDPLALERIPPVLG